MANVVVLDKDRHRHLRVATGHSRALGSDVGLCPITPREFALAAAAFPLAFRLNGVSGEHEPVALLGFQADENLYLEGEAWRASHVPMDLRRQPFLLAPAPGEANGPPRLSLALDEAHPRVSEEAGERLFFAQGLRTDFLEAARSLVLDYFEGVGQARAFAGELFRLGLLEPLRIEAELADGRTVALTGLLGVDRARLYALPEAEVMGLWGKGFLELAVLQAASLSHVRRLIDLKNARLAGAAA